MITINKQVWEILYFGRIVVWTVKYQKKIVVVFEPSLFYLFLFDFRVIGGRFVTAAAFACCPWRPRVFAWVDNGVVDCAVCLVWRPLQPVLADAAQTGFFFGAGFFGACFFFEQTARESRSVEASVSSSSSSSSSSYFSPSFDKRVTTVRGGDDGDDGNTTLSPPACLYCFDFE